MPHLKRAALAVLLLALIPAPPALSQAQRQPARPVSGGGGTATPLRLPPAQARPPATRRNTPAPVPAAARGPARAAVRPAANPAPLAANLPALPPNGEKWEDITPQAVNAGPVRLPLGRGHLGPSVLRVQVLLDRALFSPGMIDGRWGRNTQTAVFWLQAREGLPATGVVDSATYARLAQLAGNPAEVIAAHPLTAEEARGPFTPIPGDIYEQAKLDCSCYETLTEKLTETFHLKAELLQRLNPGVRIDALAAGAVVNVPAVRPLDAPAPGQVVELIVSGRGNFLQALDAGGRILYHFPTTLGSSIDPSPQGDFRVTSVHDNPWWRYQPKLLAHVPDWKPEAMVPPGPNNRVGRVWMSLSAPHYGIHGTHSPETIGYAESAGCVRLTNWDVLFLSKRVPAGTPVRFRDIRYRDPAGAPTVVAERQPAAPTGPRVLGVRADSARQDSTVADSAKPAPPPAPRPDSAPAQPPKPDSASPPAPAKPDTSSARP